MIKRKPRVTATQVEAPVVEVTPEAQAPEAQTTESPVQETQSAPKPVKIKYAKRDWAAGDIITLVQSANPKKGKSLYRYAEYRDGMTVAEYAEALKAKGLGGKTLANADLRWDVARNFISIAPKS
jgi:hypothetical protein